MAVLVPALLAVLALLDASMAGFRAATGRNARIDKRDYYRRASRRGVAGGVAVLLPVALVAGAGLWAAPDPAARYDELLAAGTRMLQVLAPYAALVLLSLPAYWLLPMRESSFVILVGLGPFTLVRPLVVLAGTAWSVAGSADWLVWVVAVAAAAGVLAVEPVVHRRWYPAPV